ncbi:pyrroline-5-carboxylate reductase [bacterium]|nr:pyrroline-5-carboxylate reductase [bacterium]MBU1754564.1 pyrroline-5-carboxylate reductase [bacterium]
MTFPKKLAFIGAGNMTEALIQGILKASLLKADEIIASDVSQERAAYIQQKTGVTVLLENTQAVKQAETIILAVKPQAMEGVLMELAEILSSDQLVISIAAGISTEMIENNLEFLSILPSGVETKLPVVRVMPNTPALVGCSATAICKGSYASDEHLKWVIKIFEAVGYVVVIDEKLMDVVTALSGSGPAYIFTIIESLIDAGVELGLSRDIATGLTVQTVKGAARMMEETREHPAILKNRVTSPGGTTAAGLHALEKNGLRGAMIEAVIAAKNRAKEL